MLKSSDMNDTLNRSLSNKKRKQQVLRKLKETWIKDYKGYESDHTTSDESDVETTVTSKEKKKYSKCKKMKNILFFGDSLTWGMAHNYTGRYERTFPDIIRKKLHAVGLNVLESGVCSRTTIFEDDGNEDWMTGARPDFFNGLSHFTSEFINATPTWLVVLLGTNDLRIVIRKQAKTRTRMDASIIAQNCATIGLRAREIHKNSGYFRKGSELNIVMVAPPLIRFCGLSSKLGYDETSNVISKNFNEAYEAVCKENNFIFVKNEITSEKSMDGVHFTKRSNHTISCAILQAIYAKVSPRLWKKLCTPKKAIQKRHSSEALRLTKLKKRKDFDLFWYIHSKRRKYTEMDLSDDDQGNIQRFHRYRYYVGKDSQQNSEDIGLRNLKYTYFRRGRPSRQEIEFKPIGVKVLNHMIETIEKSFEAC